jgi:hypothetical protein
MRSKGNSPTAKQKQWRETVRGLGSILSGDDAIIHHPVGATGKHNKVHIGNWWLVPLTNDEHLALHAGVCFGHASRKEFEKAAFTDICQRLYPERYITDEIYDAIQDFHI